MNLLNILSYRSNCMICNHKLEMKSLNLANVNITKTKEGLRIKVNNKDYACYFRYDGIYEKMKKWNITFVKPLSILNECPKCIPKIDMIKKMSLTAIPKTSPTIILKAASPRMSHIFLDSNLNSLKDKRCAYTFDLFGDTKGNFDCLLNCEDIRFHTKTNFYHIKTDFNKNITNIKSGSFKGTIDNIISMKVPQLNSTNILSTDKLIEKIKLYNLFS